MRTFRNFVAAAAASATLLLAACGTDTPPASPTPAPPPAATAVHTYILPGAVNLASQAFGDEAIVIHKGERMRMTNADSVEHNVVADTASLPEFVGTGTLAPGSEQTFTMNTAGTTTIHCTIHPQMTGTLIVQEQ